MLLPDEAPVKRRVFTVRRVARTTSTQNLVRGAARRGEGDGLCVVAAEQSAGRGRQGRVWEAAAGTALLCSTLIRLDRSHLPGVPFAAGLAAADAIERSTSLRPTLKWPNDVLLEGRKLAGLLVEVEPGAGGSAEVAAIIGLGLNRTTPEFPQGAVAISLHQLTPNPPSVEVLLQAWLTALGERIESLEVGGTATVLALWRQRAAGLGERVAVERPSGVLQGIAEDVGEDGALLLRDTDGRLHRLLAGDVHLQHG